MDVAPDRESATTIDWRLSGVRVVRGDELDSNTPQTPGMSREAAITAASAGAEKLWAGTVVIQPDAKTGAHHHGALESVIYVVSGRARMRWGERLEFTAEAGPGGFIYLLRTRRPRRSTGGRTSRSRALSSAAARSRSSSTSTCRTWRPTPKRSTGSTTSIGRRRDRHCHRGAGGGRGRQGPRRGPAACGRGAGLGVRGRPGGGVGRARRHPAPAPARARVPAVPRAHLVRAGRVLHDERRRGCGGVGAARAVEARRRPAASTPPPPRADLPASHASARPGDQRAGVRASRGAALLPALRRGGAGVAGARARGGAAAARARALRPRGHAGVPGGLVAAQPRLVRAARVRGDEGVHAGQGLAAVVADVARAGVMTLFVGLS